MRCFRSTLMVHDFQNLIGEHSVFKIVFPSLVSSGRHSHGCNRKFSVMKDLPKEVEKDSIWQTMIGSDSDDLDLDKAIILKLGKKNCYVKDSRTGGKLVQAIMKNRINPKAPILDIQAGPGIVSAEFLRQGVSQVVALEKKKIFQPQLSAVQEKFGSEKFQYFKWNILNFFFKFNDQVMDDNQSTYRKSETSVFNLLSKSPYGRTGGREENHNVIFYIMRNLPHEDQILSTGRVEYFLIVHPKFKASMELIMPLDQPSHFSRHFSYFHTFMALLYDVQFIEEFNVNDFLPPFFKTGGLNADKRYLMRIQIKENVSEILPFEHHHAFSIFLRHIFHKRKVRIIPAMEMLINGCGIQMLASGFSMMDTIVDIAPLRLLHLYKDMVTWPEYGVSHFKNHIEMKTQGGLTESVETIQK